MNYPTIRLAAKPHVIRFLYKHLYDVASPSAPLRIPRKEILLSIIKGNITNMVKDRAVTYPDGYETIDILLPKKYRAFFLAADSVESMARSLEEYYWMHCNMIVLKTVSKESQHMDMAIKKFQNEYNITESIYPIGNMRRQMNRNGIRGVQLSQPNIEPRFSSKLSNAEVKQIYKLHTSRHISFAEIAKFYNIGKSTVYDIVKKYKRYLSKNRTKSERLTA